MMAVQLRLLPSELARLVLGYLTKHDCCDAAENFLKELPELGECLTLRKHGRPVCTNVGDRSLEDMLNDYTDAREQVQNSIQQHPGALRKISKSWDLNQQLQEITRIATEKKPTQDLGMLGRKSSSNQMGRTRILNKQLRDSMLSTQTCCEHCVLKNQKTQNPLLDVSTTSIKDLPGLANHSLSNPVEDDHITEYDCQDLIISPKKNGSEDAAIIGKIIKNNSNNIDLINNASKMQLKMSSGLQPGGDSQSNIESLSHCQELSNSNISSSSIDGTPQKRKGNQVKRRSQGPSNIPETVEEDVHFEIMLKKLMEDTSLHEKIAENINRGLNSSQSRGLQQSNSQDLSSSAEGFNSDGSKIERPGDNSTFPCELESIITNIVSETTDGPDFEMILGEVFGSSLLKSANMNSEGVQNDLSGIPARPLSTPIPHLQSVDNISTQRSSLIFKENNQNDKINEQVKMCDSNLRDSSQMQNYPFRNEMLSETSNTEIEHKNNDINELAMKITKIANTDDIFSKSRSSTSEKDNFSRLEMNVPHKLRHKFNRNSLNIQLNSNSGSTPQTDNLLIVTSQLHEKNEKKFYENVDEYISEKNYNKNHLDKEMEHVNDTDNIRHVEIQSQEIEIVKNSINNQNCANQMCHKIDLVEMKKSSNQVDEIDDETDGSRESLKIECSLPSLDKTYRISDISNIPDKTNRNKSEVSSEVIEQVKNSSESLLQITSAARESIFTSPDSINDNESTNEEISLTNTMEITGIPSADFISRNVTPIKSLTIPGIATTLPIQQKGSPYKIIERDDSTLTELKPMRSDISSLVQSSHWSPNLTMEENLPSKSSTPISISNPLKEMDNGFQLITSLPNTNGGTTLAQVQIIPLPKNIQRSNSHQRYHRTAARPIAPRLIAPKLDPNLSYRKIKDNYGTANPDTKDYHNPDTPLIKLPIDTLVFPAIESIKPASVSTYKLANNVTFTIPNIPTVMSIPDQIIPIDRSEENNKNSPSQIKSPKSPIRGRIVNMTRVKNKKGVGKAGKRKLRAQKELENVSKTNDLVNAAIVLSLSATPTKKKTPLKELTSQSDSKINNSSNMTLQKDAATGLAENECEKKYGDFFQLGSISPRLKDLLQISKNIGSGRGKMKPHSVHKSPIRKGLPSRGSQSTPSHKNSHIRALDFGTPGKDISPRKLRRQQVMQYLNFSPSLHFKKNSTVDDSFSKPSNMFSPKKRILERIQEEKNNTLNKDKFVSSESMKKLPMSKIKARKSRKKSSIIKPNVNNLLSKEPHADIKNINDENSKNSKIDNNHKDKEDCIQIVNNPLSIESISNSVNEKLCDSSNKKNILETPFKTNDILTLELATPLLKSVKNTCDDEEDLNTPFPRISKDYEQNRSPKIDENPISTSSFLSSHYQPGIKDQNVSDFPESVDQTANTKNHEKDLKKEKIGKKNIILKKKINQKNISEIKMGKKIEEEIASRFGSPNSYKLSLEMSKNKSKQRKQSSPGCHDVKKAIKKETKNISSKSQSNKDTRLKRKRSATKMGNSLCVPEEKLSDNLISSQKIADCNENINKSKEEKENMEKRSRELMEQHCDKTDSLATELQNKNDVNEILVKSKKKIKPPEYRMNMGSDESSVENYKLQIDVESQESNSRRLVEEIEDQNCDEYLQCKNINSESDENSEYEEENFLDLNLKYTKFIDIFSMNLKVTEQSVNKNLNKRLWVEGSSNWSPKRKRPRIRRKHGNPRTPSEEKLPFIDGKSALHNVNETLSEEEKQMEITETMERLITPARGSVSERSVGSSAASNSPGRLVISQSPYWKLDDNVLTPNQSLVVETKEECSQNSESNFIEEIENLKSPSHKATTCLKCNKEVKNSYICLEEKEYCKKGSHCVCESSDENQKSFVAEGDDSSDTSFQNQQRSKKVQHINKVLFNGGTLEIAQSPTKQMAIVTEPQVTQIQIPSIDGINEDSRSNASIIPPPTPGKNLDLGEHGISSLNSCKINSNSASLSTLPPNTKKRGSNNKKGCKYNENNKSTEKTFTRTEKENDSFYDNSYLCTLNSPKQIPSLISPENESKNSRTNHSEESKTNLTVDSPQNSSAVNISSKDVSEDGVFTNLTIVKPKKKIKLVEKMNIEEFLKNVHKGNKKIKK